MRMSVQTNGRMKGRRRVSPGASSFETRRVKLTRALEPLQQQQDDSGNSFPSDLPFTNHVNFLQSESRKVLGCCRRDGIETQKSQNDRDKRKSTGRTRGRTEFEVGFVSSWRSNCCSRIGRIRRSWRRRGLRNGIEDEFEKDDDGCWES